MFLDAMHRSFSGTIGRRHVYLLYGLGGAGKTQIAYKFVAESQENQRYAVFHLRTQMRLVFTVASDSLKSFS